MRVGWGVRFCHVLAMAGWLAGMGSSAVLAQKFGFPTANRALLEAGGEERFFVGTVGKPASSGAFGCVRTDGHQMHEGLDIRCLQRDGRGEPVDPVQVTAAGTVAYVNRKAGLSNYGNYLVVRHQMEGLEIYSLYAHLSSVRADLAPGRPVQAGETVATMGRTSNTRQRITKDRAHVHFELDFQVNPRFDQWHKERLPGQRNDHGVWNGLNLLGIDPRWLFLAQAQHGANFSLIRFMQSQVELCRVTVRGAKLPLLKECAPLVQANPVADREGVAGYELTLNFNGVPFRIVPRAASELKGGGKFQLLAVNEAEEARSGCRRLVAKRGDRWELSSHGEALLDLLTY